MNGLQKKDSTSPEPNHAPGLTSLSLLENHTDEQNTRASLELLYNVSREIAAALDLRTVLQRVLFLAMKNLGAINGSIIVLDEAGQPVESAIITGTQLHGQTTQQLRITFERGLAGWVTQHNQAVLVPDTSKDNRWLRRPDDELDRTGPKSAVSAPITAREQLVGVMTLVHPNPGFFTQDHLELLQAISDQAGVAVLNARLYTDSQRQARVMTALAESSMAIAASLKLDDVLQHILEQISLALQCEVVSLALIDSATQELVFRASSGHKENNINGIRLKVGQGIAGWVALHGLGTIVPNVREDSRFFSGVDKVTGFTTKAIACAPIRSEGQVIGILQALNPTEGQFDPDALLVLTGIGSLAGTAIQHAELYERQQAAHQRYRELFEDSIDPIMITDLEGTILEANRQAYVITATHKDELHGKNITDFRVVDRREVGNKFENLAVGNTISYETILFTPGGREFPVQVTARKVQINGTTQLQWLLHDISERKHLDNLRNDLISMVYHDLRSPLANIVSSLDVLEAMLDKDVDPTQKSLVEIAIRSTERIQRLTNSLLDMRRLEAGQPITSQQVISPITLANDAVDTVMPIIENKRQEITIFIPPDLPDVWADADMLRRVLTNLLENAVKYTPAGSKIYIGAAIDHDKVMMWVQDTGPGIPIDDRERIFDKYTRLHGRGGPKGLGLGLAFCKLAIEAHHGQIWVEDGAEAGAVFKFMLPIHKSAATIL